MILRWILPATVLLSSLALRAEVLDRIAATVNGHVILLSDWDDELRYESFMSGRKLEGLTGEQQKAALDHLIDQELLREQIRPSDAKTVSPDQVDKQLDSLKADVLRENPGNSWQQVLARYHLNEDFVRNHITAELQQLQTIDTRFRPSIQVSPAEVEQYYKEQFVPKLAASDAVPISEVSPKIREILVQNKEDQMLNSWLESLRSQAQIRMFETSPAVTSSLSRVGPR